MTKHVFNLNLLKVTTCLRFKRGEWVVEHILHFDCGCHRGPSPDSMHDINYWCNSHWGGHVRVVG